MERRDAVKALARAGKYAEVIELIDQHANITRQHFERVRSDTSRTEEWQQWALASVSAAAISRLDDELASRAQKVIGTDRRDAASVFGVLGINGDEASKTISRRDAGDRVSTIEDPQELSALLARATRQDDEILARAAAERALEIQDTKTLEQFIADRPQKKEAVVRLWDAERAGNDTMRVTMAMSALLPENARNFADVQERAARPEPGAAESTEPRPAMPSPHTPVLQAQGEASGW